MTLRWRWLRPPFLDELDHLHPERLLVLRTPCPHLCVIPFAVLDERLKGVKAEAISTDISDVDSWIEETV